MRKKGSNCDFTAERNENLKQMFKACFLAGNYTNIGEIFGQMATMPAKRFYINEQRAYQLLCEKRRTGHWKPSILANKLRMMEEIEKRVDELMLANPSVSLVEAVDLVVNQPAPSLYLTPRSIRTIFYNV